MAENAGVKTPDPFTCQWLIYRSLSDTASRTLLGHNLNGETLVARFLRDGEVETIVEVE